MKRPTKNLIAALRDWRPTIPGEMASLAPDKARGPAELVAAAMARFKLTDQLNESAVIKAWTEAAGPLHARHTQPRALRNGVLVVSVSNSTLLAELRTYAKRIILHRLQEKFGSNRVRDIAFRMDG
jgi:predicted nucleic acid-binding Zn ribbon protein